MVATYIAYQKAIYYMQPYSNQKGPPKKQMAT